MTRKLSITKSKAGHYTVTVRENKLIVFKQNLIGELDWARKIATYALTELEMGRQPVRL